MQRCFDTWQRLTRVGFGAVARIALSWRRFDDTGPVVPQSDKQKRMWTMKNAVRRCRVEVVTFT